MFIMLIAFWVFALPFGYSLAVTDFWNVQLGAPGMWTGMFIGLVLCAFPMVWRMNYVTSKSLKFEKKGLAFNEMELDGFKLKL